MRASTKIREGKSTINALPGDVRGKTYVMLAASIDIHVIILKLPER